VDGGFTVNNVVYPQITAHLNGQIPLGGFAAYKDAHVQWNKFYLMTPRTDSGTVFWW